MQCLLLKRDTIPFLNTSEAMKLHLNPLVPGIHYYKLGQLLQIEVIVITRCTADVNLFNDKAIWKPVLFKAVFFFLSGLFSQTLPIHRTAGEGRGPSFSPFYHSHPFTNIETFICNFAYEMNITYF